MIGVGPFSVQVIVAAGAALLAWVVPHLMRRRYPNSRHRVAAGIVLDALFIGLIAARLGYVLRWWPDYASAPRSILALGDGGFYWWAGLPVALIFVWWRTRQARWLRRPVLTGIAAGMLAWGATQGALALLDRNAPPLPNLTLTTLDARQVPLAHYLGRPIVMNLWATWCPPCRRELPMLAHAQQTYPGVTFLMIDQGEGVQTVRAFLAREGLQFDHVLLDPSSRALRAAGSQGLPTTVFFDANGRMIASHMGELTAARLQEILGHSTPR